MDFDIKPLLDILNCINPLYATAATAALAAWLLIKKARSDGGLQLGKGGLLDILGGLLGRTKPVVVPTPGLPDSKPDADEGDTLLEILAKRLKERLRVKALEAGDDHAAISEYAKIVKLLDRDGDGDIDADDFESDILVDKGPAAR